MTISLFRIRAVLVAAVGLLLSGPVDAQPRPERPNIIFITAYYLGYADLSSYGRSDYATPEIDRLVREGVPLLKSAGYETALVGKWRLAYVDGSLPNDHGYDEFFGILDGGAD